MLKFLRDKKESKAKQWHYAYFKRSNMWRQSDWSLYFFLTLIAVFPVLALSQEGSENNTSPHYGLAPLGMSSDGNDSSQSDNGNSTLRLLTTYYQTSQQKRPSRTSGQRNPYRSTATSSLFLLQTSRPASNLTNNSTSLDSPDLLLIIVVCASAVAAVAIMTGIILCIQHHKKQKFKNEEEEETTTENIKSPIFEEDTPSVMEVEMDDLDKWEAMKRNLNHKTVVFF
ncbi:transmembrane protein 154 isoform X2 [Protopterus annectens]|uniref:transmembrane protein 154 isoform X2 n=1 Tax=Protopterus annectens TaxID=7888 RepID=UPI001CFB240F|nr:transmembrane protein 154 isoform X2 [Protopterus annectens]